jgi:hypothetical protein
MKIQIQRQTVWIAARLIAVLVLGMFRAEIVSAGPSSPPVRGQPIGGSQPTTISAATNSLITNAATTVNVSSALPSSNTNTTGPDKNDQFISTGFEKLAAFNFDTGTDAPVSADNAAEMSRKILAQIPANVKALNEKRVAVRGFMLPMKLDHGLVTEFLLLRNQMGCCYGLSPSMNELIDVRTAGKGVPALMDDLITVYGTLHVAEVRENGYLTGIYKMDCERVQ